jgi:hypothetical protein
MTATKTFTAPREGTTEGRLELRRGATHITVLAADIDADLCRAEFEGIVPQAAAQGGVVRIEYPRFSAAELLRRPHHAQIELSRALPWSVACAGGFADSRMDLRGLELRGLEIAGGVSDVSLVLPAPRGPVPVRIEGGASKLTLHRPSGTAAVLQVARGASQLAFDAQRFGAIGGATRVTTTDADSATDRYEIEIAGGASTVTVGEGDA